MPAHTFTVTSALVRDTFREAFARKIFWGLFGLSTALIFFFLFLLKIDVVEGAIATVSLFGRPTHNQITDVTGLVQQFYSGIAGFLYWWGTFLAVFASSGLIPSVLEPGRIELLLSKPVARHHILLGRYLGNVLVVLCNIVYTIVGIWIIFGIKTGVWGPQFLLAIATTLFIFSVLLSVVVLIGVLFESPALATMIAVALMIMTTILAQKDTMVKLLSSEWSRNVWLGLYYAFPKVFDVFRMTMDVITEKKIASFMPIWSSAIFTVAVLSAALYVFSKRDF